MIMVNFVGSPDTASVQNTKEGAENRTSIEVNAAQACAGESSCLRSKLSVESRMKLRIHSDDPQAISKIFRPASPARRRTRCRNRGRRSRYEFLKPSLRRCVLRTDDQRRCERREFFHPAKYDR